MNAGEPALGARQGITVLGAWPGLFAMERPRAGRVLGSLWAREFRCMEVWTSDRNSQNLAAPAERRTSEYS